DLGNDVSPRGGVLTDFIGTPAHMLLHLDERAVQRPAPARHAALEGDDRVLHVELRLVELRLCLSGHRLLRFSLCAQSALQAHTLACSFVQHAPWRTSAPSAVSAWLSPRGPFQNASAFRALASTVT